MKLTPTVNQFVQLVQSGVKAWFEAGAIAAAQIDEDPEWPERVCAECPEISEEVVWMFDRIGRKQLHPKLLLNDCPGYQRLRKLPYDVQEKLLTAPVEVLVTSGETLRVDVRNLTSLQAKQVFDRNGVRSLAKQRAWVESEASAKTVPLATADVPYRVVGRQVVVTTPCKLTAKELIAMLSEIEK